MDETAILEKVNALSFLSRVGEREPKPRDTTNEASALTARESDARVLSLVIFENADPHISYHHLFCQRVCFCKKI